MAFQKSEAASCVWASEEDLVKNKYPFILALKGQLSSPDSIKKYDID